MPKKRKKETQEVVKPPVKNLTKRERRKKLVFELKRKTVHALASIYLVVYWLFLKLFGYRIAILVLVATLLFFIIVEFFRIIEHKKIPVFHFLWRRKEENSLGGQVYFMLGLVLALSVFEFKIALAVTLMTVFGDMAAALFGIAFGKHWIPQLKETAWEGILAEFAVDLIIGWIVLGNWMVFIPMAAMATLVETIFPHVDDNLAIPVFSGFVGQCLRLIF